MVAAAYRSPDRSSALLGSYGNYYKYWHGNYAPVQFFIVDKAPIVWEKFSVYFIKGPLDTVAAEWITDENGVATRVGDGLFMAWQQIPGNETKTYDDFTAAFLALSNAAVNIGTPGHTHTQTTPAATWSIPHTLGFIPTVTVYDSAGRMILADVTASTTVVTVTMGAPDTGSARLS
jgi:hypothetical protein